MTITIGNNLKVVSSVLQEGAVDNLNRLGTPSARKISATTNIDRLGGSGILRHSLSLTRGVDPLLEESMRKQVSHLEKTNTITSYLRSMQSVISGGKNVQESILVKSVDEFFAQAKLLQADNTSIPMKKAFIDKAEHLAQRVTDITAKGINLQLQADNQMKESVVKTNSAIKSLFDLNRKMCVTPHPMKLHDLRDNLIHDVAKYMDVKATFGNNGSVLLQSKSSGKVLVSGDYYAQFNYPGIQSEIKLQQGIDWPPMMMTQVTADGKKSHHDMVVMGGSNDETLEFSGGQWGAIVELRKDILPQIVNTAKCVGKNITKSINDLHNSGSTFPPKSRFESAFDVYGSQIFEWKPFTIHAIDKNGNQLVQSNRLFNPLKIDMSGIKPSKGSESTTLVDMIKEINLALDGGPSSNRAAIGAILDGNQHQIENNYLVNNIQLKSNSSSTECGRNFSFNFALEGNSYFGSEIQIVGITASDVGGANPVQNIRLPENIRLEKGLNNTTNQPVNIQWQDVNQNPKEITIEVRVIGDNGQKHQGRITYTLDPNNTNINDQISVDTNIESTGDFVAQEDMSISGSIGRAMLLDNSGTEIDIQANPNARGRLVIQTTSDNYCLGIEGSLGQIFEFNNMFEFDDITGKMQVNSRITNDVNELALGRVRQDAGLDVIHTTGNRAAANLNFNFDNGNIAEGDVVRIGGHVFEFTAAPHNDNHVLIADGLNGLREKINYHPDIGQNVIATVNGSTLTIESRSVGGEFNAGENREGVGIYFFLTGGARIAYNNFEPQDDSDNVPAEIIGLTGGTDNRTTSKIYKYSIKSGSAENLEDINNLQSRLISINGEGFIPTTEVSLSNLATIFTGVLSDTLQAAETESGIASHVLERTQFLVQDKFGIKRDEEYIKAIEDGRLLQSLARLLTIVNNIETKVQDIIFS